MQVFFNPQDNYEKVNWMAGYQCCVTIYTFIAFGLVLVGTFSQSKIMDRTPNFYVDWDQNPIYDVVIKQVCDPDHVNLLHFDWPGTEEGCDCRGASGIGGDFNYTNFYYMECSEQMLSQNCKKATTFNGTQFKKWPLTTNNVDVQNGYQICGKKNTMTFMQAFKPFDLNVPTGYRRCADYLTLPYIDSCPIQELKLNSQGQGTNIEGKYSVSQQTVVNNVMPISGFSIGFESICFKNKGIQAFQYLDKYIKYSCEEVDQRYQSISLENDITYQHLLRVNEKLTDYHTYFNNIDYLNNYNYLFRTQFTQFNYNNTECTLSDLDFMYKFKSFLIENVLDVQLFAQVSVGILAGVFGFLIPLIVCISMVGCDIKFVTLDKANQHFKELQQFWLGSKLITEIVCVVALAADVGYQQHVVDKFQGFIDNKCSDQFTLSEMDTFLTDYRYLVYNYVLLCFLLIILSMVLDLFLTKKIWTYVTQHQVQPYASNILTQEEKVQTPPKKVFSDRQIPN